MESVKPWPAVTLLGPPPSPSHSPGPDTGGSGVNHFVCSIDNGPDNNNCTSPFQITSLSDGQHTFRVAAIDTAGNDPQVTFTWTVDATAPQAPQINEPSDGTHTNQQTLSVAGTGVTGDTINIYSAVGSQTPIGTTTVGGAGTWATFITLTTDGPYQLVAFETDTAGNTSPQSNIVNIVLDTQAPDATITSAKGVVDGQIVDIPNNGNSRSTEATFTFTTSDPNDASPVPTRCEIDQSPPLFCTSPVTYTNLAEGLHTAL